MVYGSLEIIKMENKILALPLILSLAGAANADDTNYTDCFNYENNVHCTIITKEEKIFTETFPDGSKHVKVWEDNYRNAQDYRFNPEGDLTLSQESDLNGLEERTKRYEDGDCVNVTLSIDYEDDIFENYEGLFPFEDTLIDSDCDGELDRAVNSTKLALGLGGSTNPTCKHYEIFEMIKDANPGRF
jgi:hypothetical protein